MTDKKSSNSKNFSPLNQIRSNLWYGAEEDHCGVPFSSSWAPSIHENSKLHEVEFDSDVDFEIDSELEPGEELPF